jgi:ribulose-bisphosphate carboxylase small chain
METTMQDYGSRMGDPGSKKFGTFSYLPALDAAAIRRQVDYMVAQGWNCAVEHVEPERAGDDYWYMWKLPLFGEREVDRIMAELTACRNANPGHHVRQTQGLSIVVVRGDG